MSTEDYGSSQSGDHHSRDRTGRDHITVNDLDAVLRFIEGVSHSSDALAEAVIRMHEEIAQLRKEARRAEQDAAMERAIGMEARIKQEAATAARIASLDRRFAWLTTALFVAVVILSILVWREWAALAARAAFDALALSR